MYEHVCLLKAHRAFNRRFAERLLVFSNHNSVMKLPGVFALFTGVCTAK